MPSSTLPRVLRTLALLALLAVLLAPTARGAGAQEMARLMEQAESAGAEGRHRAAGELYERAFAVSGEEVVLRYLAARSWAGAGEPDRAFAALEAVVRAGWPHAARARADTMLAPLHADPRWARVMAEADARAAALDASLREELLRLAAEDQRARAGIGPLLQLHGRSSPQADSAFAAMAAADAPVQARLRQIVAERGWPGRRLVADDGAHAAWLLLQHADSGFQREVLPAVRRAAAAGDARRSDAAYLEDRVLVAQGRPQRFGTQLRFAEATGRPELYPIEDEARVDERRAAAGMGTLADYLAVQGIERRGPGAEGSATVRGGVVDARTGAPLADAYVSLGADRRVAVDVDGRFTVCRVAPGATRLWAQSFGYVPREEPVVVAPGDTTRVSLALHRSGVVRIREGGGPFHPGMLVFVDGVRVFHSSSGCEAAPPGMPTLADFDPGEFAGVEVVKGSDLVAAYGPEARHGALRITTRRKARRPAP